MAFGGLYISISGLTASRTSLDTISHNMANSNNPHYVRQSALHTNAYYRGGMANAKYDSLNESGRGVSISTIRQIRDEFLDIRYRGEHAKLGYHRSKAQVLQEIEGIFMEKSDSGIQGVLQKFWDNANELSKEPESLIKRELTYKSAIAVTDTFNHIHQQLEDVKLRLNDQVYLEISRVNSMTNRIAELNEFIKTEEGPNSRVSVNDLKDERNRLLDELSQILPITVRYSPYNEAIVNMHGRELINSGYVNQLKAEADPNNFGYFYPAYDDGTRIELKSGEGSLGGMMDVRDVSIVRQAKQLDTLVHEFADAVNQLHRTGKGLKPPYQARNFFTTKTALDPNDAHLKFNAGNITMNPELFNVNHIAASESGAVGDGKVIEKMGDIRKALLFTVKVNGSDRKMNVDEYYRNMIFTLGDDRQASLNGIDYQGKLIRSVDERRKEISAVSLDEEMADMLKFQHSYSANSRVVNAIDEMLDVVINRIGLVGR